MERSSSTTRMCTGCLPGPLVATLVACIISDHSRQFDYKLRAAILLGNDTDTPAVCLHNLVNDGQSQPGSTLEIGLQRLKYLGALFGVQADTCVSENNLQQEGTLF